MKLELQDIQNLYTNIDESFNRDQILLNLPQKGWQLEEFDQDLNNLAYRGKINSGEIDTKSRQALQRKYNLNSVQLDDTLEELFLLGYARAMVHDLSPEEYYRSIEGDIQFAKEGGTLIPKFVKGLEIIERIFKKEAAEVTEKSIPPKLIGLNTKELVGEATKYFDNLLNHIDFKQHSISEVVSKDGTVDYEKFRSIVAEVEEKLMEELPEYTRPLDTVVSKSKKRAQEAKNALIHSEKVSETARNLPAALNHTMQELNFAALTHDWGKMLSQEEHLHGPLGALIVSKVFKDVNPSTLLTILNHMGKSPSNPLAKAIHIADIDNGQNIVEEGMFPLAKSRWDRSKTLDEEKSLAKQGFAYKNHFRNAHFKFKETKKGFGLVEVDSQGNPIMEYIDPKKGKLFEGTLKDLFDFLRKEFELVERKNRPYIENLSNEARVESQVPIYTPDLVRDVSAAYLDSNTIRRLISDASKGDKVALHVLLNMKDVAANPDIIGGLKIIGGKTAGKTDLPLLLLTRITPGQISEMVDLSREGYSGFVAPVVKGLGNWAPRNEIGYTVNSNMDFGQEFYTSNSPTVGLRYADLRVLPEGTTWELLFEGLPREKKEEAMQIIGKILDFNKKHGIKQYGTHKTVGGKRIQEGTYQDLPKELYLDTPEQKAKRLYLIGLMDELQRVLGKDYLGVGGIRRGIVTVDDDTIFTNWSSKRYAGMLPKDAFFYDLFMPKTNHSHYIDGLRQLGFQHWITSNIGESLAQSHKYNAPYAVDFVTNAYNFRVASRKHGGDIQYFKE